MIMRIGCPINLAQLNMVYKTVVFERSLDKWRCCITFSLTTTKHFTDEICCVESAYYKNWFIAWWNAKNSLALYVEIHGVKF